MVGKVKQTTDKMIDKVKDAVSDFVAREAHRRIEQVRIGGRWRSWRWSSWASSHCPARPSRHSRTRSTTRAARPGIPHLHAGGGWRCRATAGGEPRVERRWCFGWVAYTMGAGSMTHTGWVWSAPVGSALVSWHHHSG
jgi:hypothetical protein